MNENVYAFDGKPRSFPRWLLAIWRFSRDPENIEEVAIVQIGFAKSKRAKRFARWDALAAELSREPVAADLIARRDSFGPVDLEDLERLPAGSLGRTFYEHCQREGLNPNLVRFPKETDGDFVMSTLYETHDLWHLVTGWGTDDDGEIGLGGFYLAQMEVRLILLVATLLFLNAIFVDPTRFRSRLDAFSAGYQMGKRAQPLFKTRWKDVLDVQVLELRTRFDIDTAPVTGAGIQLAA